MGVSTLTTFASFGMALSLVKFYLVLQRPAKRKKA